MGQFDNGLPALIGLPDHGKIVRSIHGQRPQQDRVDRAEDGAVRTNRQRKRQNGGQREPGRLAQVAPRVAKIVDDCHREAVIAGRTAPIQGFPPHVTFTPHRSRRPDPWSSAPDGRMVRVAGNGPKAAGATTWWGPQLNE
jgi:hypothetical protein